MSDLCHPVFVRSDIEWATEVENMPGIFYYPLAAAIDEIKRVRDLGVKHFVIWPRPSKSTSTNVDDIIAFESWVLSAISKECPDVTKIVDGYFGMIRPSLYYVVVNDDGTANVTSTLRELQDHAVGQGRSGADIIVTLGRVDHAVKAIREALDQNGLYNVGILAYSVNFASSLALQRQK